MFAGLLLHNIPTVVFKYDKLAILSIIIILHNSRGLTL